MEQTAEHPRAMAAPDAWRLEARRGFLAISPLWPGAVAFATAFALIARAAGFTALETQAMSLFVFAGSAQLAAVSLFAGGAGAFPILLTVLVLNLRHVLYGLSLNRLLPARTRLPRPLLAFFLTDEAYGFAIRRSAGNVTRGPLGIEPYYIGACISLYSVFVLGTLAGLLFGAVLPDPQRIALSFIFPLTFLALLMPFLVSRRAVLVAACAGVSALGLSTVAGSGETFVGATLLAAGLGTWLDLRDNTLRAA